MSVTDLILDPFTASKALQTLLQKPQFKLFLERLETDPSFRSLFLLDPARVSLSAGVKLKPGAAEKIRAVKVSPYDLPPVDSILIALLIPSATAAVSDGTSNTIMFADLSARALHWGLFLLPFVETTSDDGRSL